MSEKVSIIVPIYKVEKYLERCIESLVNQTYENIEIILVDDESPDSCPEICDAWAKKDSRVKVIHKKNAGLGMARNSGIEVMTGDYCTFVDSDDYLDVTTCETVLAKLREYGAEACFYNCYSVTKTTKFRCRGADRDIFIEGDEVVNDFLLHSIGPDEYHTVNDYPVALSSCMAFYSTKLFSENGLRFTSEREYVNEDLMFRYSLCRYLKSLVIIPYNFYYYYHRTGSLTTSYNPKRLDTSVAMYLKGNEVLSVFESEELIKKNTRIFITNALVCVKHEVKFLKTNGLKTCIRNIKDICSNGELQSALRQYPVSKMEIQQRITFKAMQKRNALMLILLVKMKESTLKIKKKLKR